MPHVLDIEAPANTEGTKATVLKWCKALGDRVEKDEPLLEIETDKVTVEVASPDTGVLTEIIKAASAEINPGEVLGKLQLAGEDFIAPAPTVISLAMHRPPPAPPRRPRLSPAVRRMFSSYGLTSEPVQGTGRDGRITAHDVSRAVKSREQMVAPEVAPPRRMPAPLESQPVSMPGGTSHRRPHTPMRRRIAEHMHTSLMVAPHVTTVFEADLTRVIAHRAGLAPELKREGTSLTLSAYFVAASAKALQAVPEVNSTFHEDALELHPDLNIGLATALGNSGLIVPVLPRVQDMSLAGIARKINQMVSAARTAKLSPEDVRGGTFTISNHGVSGSILAAPIIINQTQVAILGVGKSERRLTIESVDGADVFKVRTKCYITLTIDHRALDAFQANAFLTHLVGALENWPDEDARGQNAT